MSTLKYLTLSLLSVLFVFTACTSEGGEQAEEAAPLTADQLSGRWDLASAVRDGKQTGSLEGTYMKFEGDNKMTCNFTGEEVNSDFSFQNNEITHGKQVYKVEQFSPSELIVSTKLMNFNFKLTFNKAQQE